MPGCACVLQVPAIMTCVDAKSGAQTLPKRVCSRAQETRRPRAGCTTPWLRGGCENWSRSWWAWIITVLARRCVPVVMASHMEASLPFRTLIR